MAKAKSKLKSNTVIKMVGGEYFDKADMLWCGTMPGVESLKIGTAISLTSPKGRSVVKVMMVSVDIDHDDVGFVVFVAPFTDAYNESTRKLLA